MDFKRHGLSLLSTTLLTTIVIVAVNAICLPDVPLSSNVPSGTAIRLLAFKYNLHERKQVEEARELLAEHGIQAIFFVNVNDIDSNINGGDNNGNSNTHKCLRDIVRDGHLVIDAHGDTESEQCSHTRFEAVLGFHLPMSVQNNNNFTQQSVLKLHLDRVSLLKNEFALDYLRNRNNGNNTQADVHNPVSLLSEAQLACMHKAMECEFVGNGELLYRLCNGYYGKGNEKGDVKLLNNNNDSGFVDRNRARIEIAYEHMKVAHRSKWRNREKSVKQILDLLYVLTDDEVADARKTGVWKYLKLYRHNNRNSLLSASVSSQSSTTESMASTCTAQGRRSPNYGVLIVALVLCTCGLYGLSPYTYTYIPYPGTAHYVVPPKITIRKLVRTLSNVRSTAEDFSKVV